MTTNGIHFTAHRSGRTASELFTCRETGDRYLVRPSILRGYELRHGGELLIARPSRAACIEYMGQHAQLSFITAQADCGAWAAIEA